MLKIRIIPCLDIKDGRVVKGINFENLIDAGDPVKQAEYYYHQGADELCFLDITASHEDRGILMDVVRRTAEACFMPLTVGGGVRSIEDIRNLLLAGAASFAPTLPPPAEPRGDGVVQLPQEEAQGFTVLNHRQLVLHRHLQGGGSI